jgi:hypothetical protein
LRISFNKKTRRFPAVLFRGFFLFIDFVHPPARLHLFKLHPNAHGKVGVANSDQFGTAHPSKAIFCTTNNLIFSQKVTLDCKH